MEPQFVHVFSLKKRTSHLVVVSNQKNSFAMLCHQRGPPKHPSIHDVAQECEHPWRHSEGHVHFHQDEVPRSKRFGSLK